MKIKEVQISNFRAFNDLSNSTFNFINSNNDISDLISIYAPNGFGKTSFYDAVEWGVTGKIERFDLVGDFEKTRKENKKGGNKNILQHIGSAVNGFVNVITDNDMFEEVISNTEYNHKKEPRNKFFRDVVLSQEMIDNFLKEVTAEERYDKFVESYPDIKKYNSTYKNMGSLLNYILQEVKRLEKDKSQSEGKQLEIDFDLEFKKFDEINDAIKILRKNQEIIDLIGKETFNETLFDVLTSQVKSRLVSLQLDLESKKARIGNIQIARTGDENNENNIGGVLNYIDNKKKLDDFDLRIKEVKDIISQIEEKDKVETENSNLKDKLFKKQNTQSTFLSVEKKIDTYLLLHQEITELEKRIAVFDTTNLKLETDNTTITESVSRSQNQVIQLQEILKQCQTKIGELPSQKNKLELSKKNEESLQKIISQTDVSISEKQNKLNELEQKLSQLHYYENYIESDLDLLMELKEFVKQKEVIQKQIKSFEKLDIQRNELVKIEDKISSQNQINDELKEYIARGLEIVSKNNSTDCPLCSQKYESFEELSNRIIQNEIFSQQLKEFLANKISIEEEINSLYQEINSRKELLKKHLNDLEQPFKDEFNKIEKEIEKLSTEKDEKNTELDIAQANYNEALIFFSNESDIEAFEKKVIEQIEDLNLKINELNKTVSSITTQINENRTQIIINNDNADILKNSIIGLKNKEDYNEVIDFFSITLLSNEISKELFETAKLETEEQITKAKNSLEEKQKLLSELESKLSDKNLSKDEFSSKLKELESLKLLTLKIYESFENYIRTEFGIVVKNKDKQEIDFEFDQEIEKEKSNQKIIEYKIEQFQIIDVLKEDCLKATSSQKNQLKINDLKEQLKSLKIAEKKLNDEKENLEIYLEKTIDEFFYTGLINTIYKKIDPHPDYETIEFKCEFGENKPRLQIFTINKDKNGKQIKSIPALYFSTAQINILSLSIFLARALKTKNPNTKESIDCIFIDDPIQSMDSINILSFIDLFRGIITSLGKQLIVSTHEENFHLLLKKKIPKEFFKSKFIEFETFGKLNMTD